MRALASRLALLLPAVTFAQTQPDANCDNVPEQCVAGITGRLGSISDCGTNGPMGYECCSWMALSCALPPSTPPSSPCTTSMHCSTGQFCDCTGSSSSGVCTDATDNTFMNCGTASASVSPSSSPTTNTCVAGCNDWSSMQSAISHSRSVFLRKFQTSKPPDDAPVVSMSFRVTGQTNANLMMEMATADQAFVSFAGEHLIEGETLFGAMTTGTGMTVSGVPLSDTFVTVNGQTQPDASQGFNLTVIYLAWANSTVSKLKTHLSGTVLSGGAPATTLQNALVSFNSGILGAFQVQTTPILASGTWCNTIKNLPNNFMGGCASSGASPSSPSPEPSSATTHPNAYTFPVKSINLAGAQQVDFYVGPDVASYGLFDVHPVHGAYIPSDGSYVMCGKAVEADGSSVKRAFAVKLSSTGTVQWVWGSNIANQHDAANAIMQLPNNGDLIVVGYIYMNGVFVRSLTKLSLTTGQEVWTAPWASSPNQGRMGAWEMAQLTADNAHVLLAGLHEGTEGNEFNFKSYGNVLDGNPIVQKISVSALTGASAPLASAVDWTWTTTGYLTSKAARPLIDGSVIVLLLGAETTKQAALVKLTSSGTVEWGPTDYASEHGEGTDLVVAADGNSFMICGQGPGGTDATDTYIAGSYSGRLTKVSLSGTREWSKSYSSTPYDGTAGPHATMIKNECWGIQAVSDGYVVGCGTGIENCNGYSGDKLTACQAGNPDTRAGAYARPAGVWQSMIFKTDLQGTLQWLRTDQLRESDAPPLEDAAYTPSSSASEYPIVTPDGGIVSINDEVGGIGLLRLKPPHTGMTG